MIKNSLLSSPQLTENLLTTALIRMGLGLKAGMELSAWRFFNCGIRNRTVRGLGGKSGILIFL